MLVMLERRRLGDSYALGKKEECSLHSWVDLLCSAVSRRSRMPV
jgi:hypothetical protein